MFSKAFLIDRDNLAHSAVDWVTGHARKRSFIVQADKQYLTNVYCIWAWGKTASTLSVLSKFFRRLTHTVLAKAKDIGLQIGMSSTLMPEDSV